METIFREVTPLSERDCFMIFLRQKNEFTFPLHIHAEYELNFIENGAGAKRIVGDSIENIEQLELTLITDPNLEHGWVNDKCTSEVINEITIQFHPDLLDQSLLNKNQFISVKELFERANYGVTFPLETIKEVRENIYSLANEQRGAHSVLKLIGILYDLSLSPNIRELSSSSFNQQKLNYDSRRIEKVYNFILSNYKDEIRLPQIANLIGMSNVAFSRFFKQRTGRSFIDALNDIRLGHASRLLVDTTQSILEISLNCGFNNLSNFNRLFKKYKNCTPSEFRQNYNESRIFL